MRIALSSEDKELIEHDKRFSIANYGSRRNYSIESAILEKRLIIDNSLNTLNHTIYNFIDLKSCYDRQLPNLGSIVEESVGRKRKPMILYTKIMLKFRKYVSTGYGISSKYYSGKIRELAETG